MWTGWGFSVISVVLSEFRELKSLTDKSVYVQKFSIKLCKCLRLTLFKQYSGTCLQDQRRLAIRTHGLRDKIRNGASEIRIRIVTRWTAIFRRNLTFMLPTIVIDFFLHNQPEPLIIPILFCYKSLHVSVIFSAHHQDFSTVHSTL
jgi:hypothetical protein